ncbi:MAG: SAF domain-containing protein [Desulfobacterales bacterium]|nr:SAF domain-containing protein [Desulfobacterales bacterium]
MTCENENLRHDLTAVAVRDLAAGERLTGLGAAGRHQRDARITPAQPARGRHPVSYYRAIGHRLRVAVTAGDILRIDMLEPPENSTLWSLRQRQDGLYLN